MRANVLRHEANGRAGHADHGADGCRDLRAAGFESLVFVVDRLKRSCASGAVASKVYDAATQLCHRTALGMACTAMTYGFSFDAIFLRGEEEAEGIRSGLGV